MENEFDQTESTDGSNSSECITPLDREFAELIETVFACERSARQLDRIEQALNYGNRRAKR
jgi:hypothetical protein